MDPACARGWLDRRRAAAKDADQAAQAPDGVTPAFIPVKLMELNAIASPSSALPASLPSPVATPKREPRGSARRGVMEISLPNGARVSLDADVAAEALRRVFSALGDL